MSLKKDKTVKKKRYPILTVTAVCVLLFSAVAVAFAAFQLRRYEEGILDVCATQQDAYVQLVLDQINLEQNHGDEEKIIEIIKTIDSSPNNYWTFSRGESMLFVKDVLETNRYHGFTTATYYISESGRNFLDSIRLNRVTHSKIDLDEKKYVASGVAFVYNGETYRLCLLTNESVLLDNNNFLRSKTELGILVIVLLMILTISSMVFASRLWGLQRKRDRQKETIAELCDSVNHLNRMLSQQDLHDTRRNVWSEDAIDEFAQKLKARDAYPSTLIEVRCLNSDAADRLLTLASGIMDKTVLRFENHDKFNPKVSFLFIQCDADTAMLSVEPLLTEEIAVERSVKLEDYVSESKGEAVNV